MPTTDSKGPQTAQQQLQKNCKSHSGPASLKTPLSLGFEWSIEGLKLEKGGLWGPQPSRGRHPPREVLQRGCHKHTSLVTLQQRLLCSQEYCGLTRYSLQFPGSVRVPWLSCPRTDGTLGFKTQAKSIKGTRLSASLGSVCPWNCV